jgi:hypothetical protein
VAVVAQLQAAVLELGRGSEEQNQVGTDLRAMDPMHKHTVVSIAHRNKQKCAHHINNIPTSLASMSRSLHDLPDPRQTCTQKKG